MNPWKTTLRSLQDKHIRLALGAALGASFLAGFIKLTSELRENELSLIDRYCLVWIAQFRNPFLNGLALQVTSLGSPIVLAILTAIALILLVFVARLPWAGLQLAIAASGAGMWTNVLKGWFSRERPDVVPPLDFVTNYSYPSGHSLTSAAIYLTLALIACRAVRSASKRAALMITTLALVGLIGFSRMYLGVHYPSDVLSGIALGSAWALIVEAALEGLRWRIISTRERERETAEKR